MHAIFLCLGKLYICGKIVEGLSIFIDEVEIKVDFSKFVFQKKCNELVELPETVKQNEFALSNIFLILFIFYSYKKNCFYWQKKKTIMLGHPLSNFPVSF